MRVMIYWVYMTGRIVGKIDGKNREFAEKKVGDFESYKKEENKFWKIQKQRNE